MPTSIVIELIHRVTELEKRVAVLMSWHKVQVGLLSAVLVACITLIVRK